MPILTLAQHFARYWQREERGCDYWSDVNAHACSYPRCFCYPVWRQHG